MINISKEKIKRTLVYTWPYYIIVSLVLGIGFSYVFSLIHKPSKTEKISIFLSGSVSNLKEFQDKYLEEFEDKNVRQIEVISSTLDNPYYLEKLTVAGYHSSDLLLLPESIITDIVLNQFALEIDNEIKNNYFNNSIFFNQENKDYGIKLNKEILNPYFSFIDEDYYIVINAVSENIGTYFDDDHANYINSFLLAKELSLNV